MGRRVYRNRTELRPVEVLSRVPYVDSIGFLVPERLPIGLFTELQRNLVNEQGTRGSVKLEKVERGPRGEGFFLVFWVHQPTPHAIKLLQQHGPAKFYAVHVALDLCVASPVAALELQEYVRRHINGKGGVPKYPVYRDRDKWQAGHERISEYVDQETGEIKVRPARRGSSIVVYADLPSKVTGQSCVHVEYRLGGATALRQEKFTSPGAVLRLPHQEFWSRRLHLWTPPSGERMAGKVAEVIGRRRKASGGDARDWEDRVAEAHEALRSAFEEHGLDYLRADGIDIAYVLDDTKLAGSSSPMRLFSPVSAGWMLPRAGTNAFWMPRDESRRTYGY